MSLLEKMIAKTIQKPNTYQMTPIQGKNISDDSSETMPFFNNIKEIKTGNNPDNQTPSSSINQPKTEVNEAVVNELENQQVNAQTEAAVVEAGEIKANIQAEAEVSEEKLDELDTIKLQYIQYLSEINSGDIKLSPSSVDTVNQNIPSLQANIIQVIETEKQNQNSLEDSKTAIITNVKTSYEEFFKNKEVAIGVCINLNSSLVNLFLQKKESLIVEINIDELKKLQKEYIGGVLDVYIALKKKYETENKDEIEDAKLKEVLGENDEGNQLLSQKFRNIYDNSNKESFQINDSQFEHIFNDEASFLFASIFLDTLYDQIENIFDIGGSDPDGLKAKLDWTKEEFEGYDFKNIVILINRGGDTLPFKTKPIKGGGGRKTRKKRKQKKSNNRKKSKKKRTFKRKKSYHRKNLRR